MGLRIRVALLALLVMGAFLSAREAVHSLQPLDLSPPPKQMLEALFGNGEEKAAYILRNCDGFVAVYEGHQTRRPQQVTAIETAGLRKTDRAMLDKGIPVANQETLLTLLEDLGS